MSATESQRSQRGFTIVELVVTVFIMVLLAGVVIPASSPDHERKLDTLQLQIQDAIDHAQSLAYHTGQQAAVKFDIPGNWLAVVNLLGVPFEDPLTRRMYVVDFDHPDQPGDIHLTYAKFDDRNFVAFDSKGEVMDPGQVRIRAGATERWFDLNAATAKLIEMPIGT